MKRLGMAAAAVAFAFATYVAIAATATPVYPRGTTPTTGEVLVAITAGVTPTGRIRLMDAGVTLSPGQTARFLIKTQSVAGGVILPRLPRGVGVFRVDLVQEAAPTCMRTDLCDGGEVDEGDPVLEVEGECACSTGSNCTWGGSSAPTGMTLEPGTFSGSGCRSKVCGVVFVGDPLFDDKWPAVCPRPGGGGIATTAPTVTQALTPDAGADAGADAGSSSDAGSDAGVDAGTDAGTDAGVDAGTDAGTGVGCFCVAKALGLPLLCTVLGSQQPLGQVLAPLTTPLGIGCVSIPCNTVILPAACR